MSTSHSCIVAAALCGSFAFSLSAQRPAKNATVLAHWDRSAGIEYNDIWGWTDPKTNREFAYVGETAGIWIVETTDPKNLVQRGWWSARSSSWRDFTNYKQYVYVATESRSGRGFRVLDMTDPNSPVDHGSVQTSTLTRAHNVSADPDTGLIYFSGSNQGVAIYDAKANPTNPPLVARWNTKYTHDLCVRRGRGYFALGSSYQCRILDVTDPKNITTIGNANTPGGYSHNAWISEDDKLLCCTDELSRGSVTPHMTVWDVSNAANPIKRGDFDPVSGFRAHNVFVSGRTAYMSAYRDGFYMIDLADPTNPTTAASYDTSTVGGTWVGAWGIYPFADSGLIYINDIENGLYVIQPDCGQMRRYGDGTAGSLGVPRARFDGATPKVAASKLRMEIENLEPNRSYWIVLSSGEGTPSTFLGANVNIDLAAAKIVGPLLADGDGKATLPTPVPNRAGLGGGKIYMQVFGDRGDGTLISSRGMWAGICR